MPIKATLMYGFNNVGPKRPGFSEVHIYLASPATTYDQALNLATVSLMNARTQLMGSNVTATGYRLSIPGQPRRSNIVYAVPNAGAAGPLNQTPSVSSGPSEIPNASIMGTFKTAVGQARAIYMAGLPDLLFSTGGTVGPNFAAVGLANNYQALWLNWQQLMLNGTWGSEFLATLPPGQPEDIYTWTQSATPPNNIMFVLPNTAAYKPLVGDTVHVRSVLMAVSSVPRPIGKWRVLSISPFDANNTQYELANSSVYQSIYVAEPGTVEQVEYDYVAYAQLTNLLQTTRRRGIGPVRPRGRSRKAVRRQPD